MLGVDPGLTRCGFGVVEGRGGRTLDEIGHGVIRTLATEDLGPRLAVLAAGLDRVIIEHQPEVVAVERVFSQHNVRTVMGTAQAAGVAILVATSAGLPVVLHTPSEVKAAVTGSGRAAKAQVSTMVTRLLGLSTTPSPADATDALALAICHIWRGGAQARLDRALSAGRGRR